MARFELKLPKMGESVAEATITNWLKAVGDKIEMDEAVLEIATDKVDSEVPSEVSGILVEQLFQKDDLVQVGQTIAIIETEGGATSPAPVAVQEVATPIAAVAEVAKTVETAREYVAAPAPSQPQDYTHSEKFFSPLVRNIAKEEGVSVAELEAIQGTGNDGRVTKNDILDYIKNKGNAPTAQPTPVTAQPTVVAPIAVAEAQKLGIPLIGVVDSNHSPIGIDYVIPGNDDSSKAVALYARGIADAIIEGRASAGNEIVRAVAAEGADEFVEVPAAA